MECFELKARSCKSYNNKYMIVSAQITNTEIFAFITVLDFKLLSRKVLFINKKGNSRVLIGLWKYIFMNHPIMFQVHLGIFEGGEVSAN